MNTRALFKLSVVISIVGILAASIGTGAVGRANAVFQVTGNIFVSSPTSGSGTAGTGSIAVSAFFATSTSTGVGGFAGDLNSQNSQHAVEGIFSLTTPRPALTPLLPCGLAGEISASGIVISGNLRGDPILVYSCVGNEVVGGLQIVDRLDPYKNFAYNGIGLSSDGSTNQWPWLTMAAAAGNTVGGGSAGAGSINIAETLVVLLVNGIPHLQGGGAFVGTLNIPVPTAGTLIIKSVSFGNGCETDIVGAVSSGLFRGQPETTSFVPVTCPPTFQQQGRVLVDGVVGFTIGTPSNTIYFGKGAGQAFFIPRVGQEVIVP